MLLMKNGRLSSSKRTKHLDIRYFYVRDLLERGIISLEHCSSDIMIADFFTKPIQGQKFQIFRDIIMNQHHKSSVLQYRSVLDNKENSNIVMTDEKETGEWTACIAEGKSKRDLEKEKSRRQEFNGRVLSENYT
jgi:hypothetical protein